MAGRDLTIRIRAEITDLQNKLRTAKQSVTDFNNEVQKSAQKRQAINDVGTAFGKLGLLAAGGLGASAKAAMDWETAWTGVMKTVDASPKQFAILEQQLRQMARTMPATHQEIAAVAEAAGQMGVATPEIASFTKTMIQLGETTNLSADEAATAIGRMKAIMGTTGDEVDNLAATVVALGNSGESTEREIVELAQGMAGAAKIVGLTEGELLAISSTLSSVGINAEAGATSVSKIFIDMATAAKTGSPDLAVWASTAEKGGLATGTFTKAMADTPALAFDAFTKGLAAIDAEGGDVFTLLAGIGQQDARVIKSLLGMAGSGDKLTKALELQGKAWEEQSAHAEEYGKRVETAQSKAQIAWNGIKDNAIDIGNSTLPVIKDLSDAVADLTDGFSKLPKPVQDATGKALALTALLGGGVFVGSRVITGVANIRNTFDQLGGSMDKTRAKSLALRGGIVIAGVALGEFIKQTDRTDEALGTFGGAISGAAMGSMFGPWGAALGGAAGALQGFMGAQGAAAEEVDALRETLNDQTLAVTENTRAFVANKLEKSGALAAAGRLGINRADLVDASMGNERAQRQVGRQVDAGFKSLPAGDPAASQQGRDLSRVASEMGKLAAQTDKAQASQRRLNAAVFGLKTTQIDKIVTSTKGIPKSVAMRITTPGAPNAVTQTSKLLANTKATPKNIRIALKAAGWKNKDIETTVATVEKLRKKPPNITTKLGVDGRSKGKVQGEVDGIKQKKPVAVKADDKPARSTVSSFVSWANNQSSSVYVGAHGPGASQLGKAGGGVVGFAGGGKVPGTPPSDPRKDNVAARTQHGTPYAIRSGEWIINERASRLNDRLLRAINSGADFSRFPGMAGGGVVGGDGSPSALATDRRVERVRLEADSSGTLYAVITSVAQDVVNGHATHQSYRSRAGGR